MMSVWLLTLPGGHSQSVSNHRLVPFLSHIVVSLPPPPPHFDLLSTLPILLSAPLLQPWGFFILQVNEHLGWRTGWRVKAK